MGNKNKYGRQKCACCGYFTITEIKEICPICFWEEDSYQEENTNDSGGPNLVSLHNAKLNYVTYGVVDDQFINYVRLPLEEER